MGDIAAFVFYFVLLGLWLLFVWPALKMRGGGRVIAVVAVAAGVTVTLYELWFWFVWSAVAPIRLDILVLSIVLVVVYGTAALVLFGSDWRWTGAAAAAVVLLAGGGILENWIASGEEGRRLTAVFDQRSALLFEAKFRNRATHDAYFGPLGGSSTDLPVGHWQAPDGSHYTRLVVNAEGRTWLFYRCSKTECHFGPEGSPLRSVVGAIERWQVTLVKRGVGQRSLVLSRTGPGMLSAEVDQHFVQLTRAVPPIAESPARESLRYLGSFAHLECVREHARVRQLWLWRAESDLYAVGIVSTLVAGRSAEFTTPMVLGTGISAGNEENADDGTRWRFQWQQQERRWRATVVLRGVAVSLELERDGKVLPSSLLNPGSFFHDEVIELAPLTGPEDWPRWFKTVLVGHFSRGEIPSCPESATHGSTP